MASGKRIGLREVRALTPGGIVWDGAVAGFGARRQRDSVAYILKYRDWRTGGSGGTPLGGTGRRGRLTKRATKPGGCSVRL